MKQLNVFKLNFYFIRSRLWVYPSLIIKIRIILALLFAYFSRDFLVPMFPQIMRKKGLSRFPVRVMIETATYCNGRCIICPASEISKELPQGKISWELYKKIIDECSGYKVQTFYPYLTNEPLLDEDIIERLVYARNKMPKTEIVLSTNASLLTTDKIPKLCNLVDMIIFHVAGINKQDYERIMPGLNFNETVANIENFINYNRKNGYKTKMMVREIITNDHVFGKSPIGKFREKFDFWRKKGIVWTYSLFFDRAGNVGPFGHSDYKIKRKMGCPFWHYPLRNIHILFNGEVVLCCMDCRREVILGNVKDKSIYDIWNSGLYNEVRDRVYLKTSRKYNSKFLCDRCTNPHLVL